MIDHNATTTAPPIKERDVLIEQTDPQGETTRCCLLTVLNRLSAIGYDRWISRSQLNAGDPIRTERGWRFQAIAEHQARPWLSSPTYSEQPRTLTADDVPTARAALVETLNAEQRRLLDGYDLSRVSKLRSISQTLVFRAALWTDEALKTQDSEDHARSGLFEGLASGVAWVASEDIVMLGRELRPRSPQIRPFDFPEAWRKDPPTDAELEIHAQGAEKREQADETDPSWWMPKGGQS